MGSRQSYSYYLPLKRPSRAASRSLSLNKDGARSPLSEKKEGRSGRASSASQASKRRSTMNSREAGYDEAEALRRAIEASKEEVTTEPGDTGPRRPKRGRTDSEECVVPHQDIREGGADMNAGNPKTSSAREQTRDRYPRRLARRPRTLTKACLPATVLPSPATVAHRGPRERRSHRRERSGSARG